MTNINFKSLAFHVLVPLMLSFIIAMLVPDYSTYYKGLILPFPELPRVIFPIVWSFLYLLMGIAAYLVDNTETNVQGKEVTNLEKKEAFKYYYAQLLVNLFWTPIFFGMRGLFVGVLWTVLLLVLVYITYRKFSRINKLSGYMFIPYVLWVLFATYYTIAIWMLNM